MLERSSALHYLAGPIITFVVALILHVVKAGSLEKLNFLLLLLFSFYPCMSFEFFLLVSVPFCYISGQSTKKRWPLLYLFVVLHTLQGLLHVIAQHCTILSSA